MTPDERIAMAMLLGGVFKYCRGEEHRNAHGWYCYEPTPGAHFAPNYFGEIMKHSAGTRYLESLGYWIDRNGEIVDLSERVEDANP